MFGFTRNVMGVVLIGVCLLLVVAWVLGDDLIPWMRAAKNSARQNFNELVDQYEMELEKQRAEIGVSYRQPLGVHHRLRQACAHQRVAQVMPRCAAPRPQRGTARAGAPPRPSSGRRARSSCV